MTERINGLPCLTAQAAAERLGTTHLKVLMLLKSKALQGELVEGTWYVTEASVAGYVPSPSAGAGHSCTGCGSGCGNH